MKVKRRQRMFPLIELAATLQEMPEELSVWIEGVGESYCWGSLKEFRKVAAEMLDCEHPAYPALVKLEDKIHPVDGIDVHGNRVVLQVRSELPIPDLSQRCDESMTHSPRRAAAAMGN